MKVELTGVQRALILRERENSRLTPRFGGLAAWMVVLPYAGEEQVEGWGVKRGNHLSSVYRQFSNKRKTE